MTIRLDHDAREVHLGGKRKTERYDTDALAVLGDFPSLERCHLGKQTLARLPARFANLTQLTHLTLRDCTRLASLDGIEGLTALRSLELSNLPLLDLERAFAQLAELPELSELVLAGETVIVVPQAIGLLHSLIRFALSLCPQLDVATSIERLGTAAALRVLELRRRGELGEVELAPLVRLTRLVLGVKLERIPPSIGALTNLEQLDLADNHLRELPDSIGELSALRELVLTRNRLERLPASLWRCLALEKLDLASNPFTELGAGIGALANLRDLALDHTGLTSLPPSIGALAALRRLTLPDPITVPDSIDALSLEVFSGPRALTPRLVTREPPIPDSDSVYLGNAARIPTDFGDPRALRLMFGKANVSPLRQLSALRRLETLVLDIADLDDAFRRLVSASLLRTLTIGGAHQTLPTSIGLLTQLARLDLELHLHELPDSIGELVNLTGLYVPRWSPLPQLPDTLGRLANLEVLSLTSHLRTLPASIGQLERLRVLALQTGDLTEFPDALAGCTALAELVFHHRGNRFDVGNLGALARLPALRRFMLTGPGYAAMDAPIPELFEALAATPIEEIHLRASIVALPACVSRMHALRVLTIPGTWSNALGDTLRGCHALRELTLDVGYVDRDAGERVIAQLPPGDWRTKRRETTMTFTRD
ncbi:MAG: hypothetical protein ABI867_31820 [Kofleriaceae bacterium]